MSFCENCRMNAPICQEAEKPLIMRPERVAVCAFQDLNIRLIVYHSGSAQCTGVSSAPLTPPVLPALKARTVTLPSPHQLSLTVALMTALRWRRLGTQIFQSWLSLHYPHLVIECHTCAFRGGTSDCKIYSFHAHWNTKLPWIWALFWILQPAPREHISCTRQCR